MVPSIYHRGKTDRELRNLVFDIVQFSIAALIKRASNKREWQFDSRRLTKETALALIEFLSDKGKTIAPSPSELLIYDYYRRLLELQKLAVILGCEPPKILLPNEWNISINDVYTGELRFTKKDVI